jgi:gliding motility-associated lipoprotein GldH
MRRLRSFFLFIILGVALFSCSEKPFYEKVYSFEGNEWTQRVKPSFTIDVKDIEKEYNFIITLRTTTDYKFSNLWIYMNTVTPDGTKAREPFQIQITNPDGTWAGIKTGTVVEHPLQFNKRKLPKKGKYIFTLEQGITDSKIDEVLDIGLRVTESKSK